MAAYQLFLYTVVGGVCGLVAILAMYSQTGTTDFLVLNTFATKKATAKYTF